MPIGDQDVRMCMIQFAAPYKFMAFPPGGGAFDQADRQHIAYTYRDIAVGGTPAGPGPGEYAHRRSRGIARGIGRGTL
jgi:hypothetical protein